MFKKPFLYIFLVFGLTLLNFAAAESSLETRLLKANQRLDEIYRSLEEAEANQSLLGLRLEKAVVTGKNIFRISTYRSSGAGEQAIAFDGYPFWFDPVQDRVQTNGNKANNLFQMNIYGRAAAGYELNARLDVSNVWPSTGGTVSAGPIFAKAQRGNTTIIVGNYHSQITPFTLYYPVLQRPYEGELWQLLRARRTAEIGLEGQARELQGVKVDYRSGLFSLSPQAAVIRTHEDGYPFYRYLFALQGGFELSPFSQVGLNYLRIVDDLRTGLLSNKPAANSVISMDFSGEVRRGLSVAGEIAQSTYSKDYGNIMHLDGAAKHLRIRQQFANVTLGYDFSHVTPDFYNPAAQSRDRTLASGAQFGTEGALTLEGFSLQDAVWEWMPFGPATPNRKSKLWSVQINNIFGSLAFHHGSGEELSPTDAIGNLSLAHNAIRHYQTSGWGIKIEFSQLIPGSGSVLRWPITFAAQGENLRARRDDDPQTLADEAVDYNRKTTAGSLKVAFTPRTSLLVGWQKRNFANDTTQEIKALALNYKPHARWDLLVLGEESARTGSAEPYTARALKFILGVDF
ncbi:MAG: hypothetical protein GX766_04750 [Firmicutes bacterium]|nr:hypothetical protein [Bacillota bacterium]